MGKLKKCQTFPSRHLSLLEDILKHPLVEKNESDPDNYQLRLTRFAVQQRKPKHFSHQSAMPRKSHDGLLVILLTL